MAVDLALQALRGDIENTAAFALVLDAAVKGNYTSSLEAMLALFNAGVERDQKNADLWIARADSHGPVKTCRCQLRIGGLLSD